MAFPVGITYITDAVTIAPDQASAFAELHGKQLLAQDLIAQRMNLWAAPEYGVAGESSDRSAWVLAQIVLITAATFLNDYLQSERQKIADAYAKMSKERHDRFFNGYKPLEVQLLNEANNVKMPKPEYAEARKRGTNAVKSAFNSMTSAMAKFFKQYAICDDPSLDSDQYYAATLDDVTNFNYRNAEWWYRFFFDQRWNRRSDMLNIGSGNLDNSFGYNKAANTGLKDLGNLVGEAAGGLANVFGYFNNRNDTVYPTQFSMASPIDRGFGLMIAGGQSQTDVGIGL